MNSREASRKSHNTIFRNMQQLFVTCNNLICCKTGLNVGGKTRNTAFQPTTILLVYPSPRPQILQNHCFQFLPGYYNRPKRNRRHGYGRKQGVLWSMWKRWIEWYGHPSNLNYFEFAFSFLSLEEFVGIYWLYVTSHNCPRVVICIVLNMVCAKKKTKQQQQQKKNKQNKKKNTRIKATLCLLMDNLWVRNFA